MKNPFESNWTNENNGVPLHSPEVDRLISVLPSKRQQRLAEKPFYLFMHFGMNTATGREWGVGNEKVTDFTIKRSTLRSGLNARSPAAQPALF